MRFRAAGVLALALLAGGCASEGTQTAELPREGERVRASIADWRWAPSAASPAPQRERAEDETDDAAAPTTSDAAPRPTRAARKRSSAPTRRAEAPDDLDSVPEAPPALPDLGDPSDADQSLVRAEVLENGIALPPLEAPPAVRAIIEAGNVIARSPYRWGGGHGKWQDTGYDCSGSVSYALAAAGLLNAPLASGPLMTWGKPGKGKWVTIYTNPGHVFMVVAGVRFDTSAGSANKRTGSRWANDPTDTSGYVARRPPGL